LCRPAGELGDRRKQVARLHERLRLSPPEVLWNIWPCNNQGNLDAALVDAEFPSSLVERWGDRGFEGPIVSHHEEGCVVSCRPDDTTELAIRRFEYRGVEHVCVCAIQITPCVEASRRGMQGDMRRIELEPKEPRACLLLDPGDGLFSGVGRCVLGL